MTLARSLKNSGIEANALRVLPRVLRRAAVWPALQGWRPDGPASELPAGVWTKMEGARVVDAGLDRWLDVANVFAGLGQVDHGVAKYTDAPAQPSWLTWGPAGHYLMDGSTSTPLTGGYAPDNLYAITGPVFDGFVIWNDARRAPWYYANGANGAIVEPIPGWPGVAPDHDWQAWSVRAFREHLVAINMTELGAAHPDRVRWSDAAVSGSMPTVWQPAPDNTAGFVDLAGEAGNLIDGMQLSSDRFGLYKQFATYTLDYVGAPYIMRARAISEVSGIANRNCAAQVPGGNVIFTGVDIVYNDGAQLRSIVDGRLRRWLARSIDTEALDRCFVTPVPSRREVWFLLPLGGHLASGEAGCHELLAWNWARDVWSMRRLPTAAVQVASGYARAEPAQPDDWESDSGRWQVDDTPWNVASIYPENTVVYCSQDGKFGAIDEVEGGDLNNPSAVTSEMLLQRESWPLDDEQAHKTVTGLVMRWEWGRIPSGHPFPVEVRIGVQDYLSEAIRWSGAYGMRDGQDRLDFPADQKLHGRYISIEVRVKFPRRLVFNGFDLEYRVGGRFRRTSDAHTPA